MSFQIAWPSSSPFAINSSSHRRMDRRLLAVLADDEFGGAEDARSEVILTSR